MHLTDKCEQTTQKGKIVKVGKCERFSDETGRPLNIMTKKKSEHPFSRKVLLHYCICPYHRMSPFQMHFFD